jgi:tripartite-type tricarboxylate transporter receptor subunit TctC
MLQCNVVVSKYLIKIVRLFSTAISIGDTFMKLLRVIQSVCFSATMFVSSAAFAQNFPDRSITLVVPAPPGGTADITARMLQEPLGKALGQTVVVDNKGGANGIVGAQAVINAKPDGHTLFVQFSGFHTMSPHLVKFPFDPLKDLQPVANVISAPQVLVVRSTLPFKTVDELVKNAKSNPGRLNYASSGNGSVQHITAELFEQITGTFIVHVPYRGTGPQLNGLLGGEVDFTLTTAPPLIGHIQSGRIRPLMVTSKNRLSALPDVPTSAQAGLKDFEVASWFAIYTTIGTPKATVDGISSEIKKIMEIPEFRKRAADQGAEAIYMNPEQLAAFARAEYDRWGKVIKAANIKAD